MQYTAMPKRAFGERVRALREARGWRQEDLAKATGLGRSTIGNVETGRQGLYPDDLFAVAAVLEVDARWLWMGDEPGAAAAQ